MGELRAASESNGLMRSRANLEQKAKKKNIVLKESRLNGPAISAKMSLRLSGGARDSALNAFPLRERHLFSAIEARNQSLSQCGIAEPSLPDRKRQRMSLKIKFSMQFRRTNLPHFRRPRKLDKMLSYGPLIESVNCIKIVRDTFLGETEPISALNLVGLLLIAQRGSK